METSTVKHDITDLLITAIVVVSFVLLIPIYPFVYFGNRGGK